ncbi:hypothetical protein D3C84_854230 [compost metagenome]
MHLVIEQRHHQRHARIRTGCASVVTEQLLMTQLACRRDGRVILHLIVFVEQIDRVAQHHIGHCALPTGLLAVKAFVVALEFRGGLAELGFVDLRLVDRRAGMIHRRLGGFQAVGKNDFLLLFIGCALLVDVVGGDFIGLGEEWLALVAVVVLQRVIGVAANAPTGDPAQLIGQGVFHGSAQLVGYIFPSGCVGGGLGGYAWEGLAPGVEAFDQLLIDHKF